MNWDAKISTNTQSEKFHYCNHAYFSYFHSWPQEQPEESCYWWTPHHQEPFPEWQHQLQVYPVQTRMQSTDNPQRRRQPGVSSSSLSLPSCSCCWNPRPHGEAKPEEESCWLRSANQIPGRWTCWKTELRNQSEAKLWPKRHALDGSIQQSGSPAAPN